MKYNLGIDLGGTNIAGGIVDENNTIICKKSIPTCRDTADSVSDGIASLSLALASEAGIGIDGFSSIGIAAPGIIDTEGGVVDYICNLPMFFYPLGEAVASRLHIDRSLLHLANDADAAALGEAIAGAGAGTDDFIMITLGTGVGGGVIYKGRILTSFNHAGGELGHHVIVAGGEKCGCGREGCAEAYCSATALIRMTKQAIADAKAASISTLLSEYADSAVDGKTAFDAAAKGDATAQSVIDKYIYYLAVMVTNFVNIFQPQVLAIGGGISGQGENLMRPLRRLVYSDIYNRDQPISNRTRLEAAYLGGDAGIIGAANLAARK